MINKRKLVTNAMFLILLINIPKVGFARQEHRINESHQTSPVRNTVQGTVRDKSGDPLIGVNIKIKGRSEGTITDHDGNYSINCNNTDVLLFSYIGYTDQEVAVNNQSTLNIVLNEDNKILDEVIVIGYGTTTRKSVVGAVDQIGGKVVEDRPVSNMSQALQGAAANLTIQQKSMDPNDNAININLRGVSTLNDNTPLVVIDGLIADVNAMNRLNPADIENISILKDAGSAAIYGSRSSNGVILITTKKGKKNSAPTVRVGGMAGVQSPNMLAHQVKGYQNATLRNMALANAGMTPKYTPEEIRDFAYYGDTELPIDQLLRNAFQQNYNVSVSGGGENSTYIFSGGYMNQESNIIGPGYGVDRYNLRSNITSEYGRLKFTSILSYVRTNGKKSQTSVGTLITDAMRTPAYYNYVMKDKDGKYLLNDVLPEINPIGLAEKGGYEKDTNDYLSTNLSADFRIIDGLKVRGVFGADVSSYHRLIRRREVPVYLNSDSETPQHYMNANRETEDYNSKSYLLNSQVFLDYDKHFGRHHVTGLIGATNESFTEENNGIKMKFTDPDLGTPTSGTELVIDGSSVSLQGKKRTSITSLLGRFGYSYNDKYYAEVSFREDASSKFASNKRWGFFPSGSLGWRISQENFMQQYSANVGDLKIRSSYGILGNQSIADYQYLTVFSVYNNIYVFNNEAVSGAGFQLGNEDLTWEKTATFNIGADFTFFDNSLAVSFDYFHKKTTDILLTPVIPTVFGGGLNNYNTGAMKNQGWDLTISYRLRSGAFNHNFSFNIADSWNEVTKFEGYEQISDSEEFYRLIRVGVPLGSYYGYKADGIFQSQEEIELSATPIGISVQPGDVKYVDRNGDGVIDSKDRYILGNAFPRFTFGFTYEVQYKGFDLSTLIQGVGKRDMMVRGELIEPFHSNYSHVMYEHQLDFWTPTNTDARWARLTEPGSDSNKNNYGYGSDRNLFDGKYLRMKNLQLGYTLPLSVTKKIGAQKLRIYVNAQNLFTLSKNSFIDPESSEFGSNMSAGGANSGRNYPTLKYFGGGFDIVF